MKFNATKFPKLKTVEVQKVSERLTREEREFSVTDDGETIFFTASIPRYISKVLKHPASKITNVSVYKDSIQSVTGTLPTRLVSIRKGRRKKVQKENKKESKKRSK